MSPSGGQHPTVTQNSNGVGLNLTACDLKLHVLGDVHVEVGGTPLPGDGSHVVAALLVVGISPDHSITRHRLASLLWPDAPQARRSERLRWLLSKLRRLDAPIDASPASISLSPASLEVDYQVLLDRLASEPEERGTLLLDRVHMPFADYFPRFSCTFESWVDEQRAVITHEMLSRLVPLLVQTRQAGNWRLTAKLARAILRIAPEHEDATLALAESMCAVGDHCRAARVLNEYSQGMEEGDAPLSLATHALRRRLTKVAALDSQSAASDAEHYVGPGASLEIVQRMLAQAMTGRGGMVLITGPASVGKTRLLDEIHTFATTIGNTVARDNCKPGDSIRAFGLENLIPQLLKMRGAIGCEPSSLRCLEQLVSLEPAPPGHVVRRAILDLLDTLSDERPLVIIIDDLQWSDRALTPFWDVALPFSSTRRIAWYVAARAERPEAAMQFFSADIHTPPIVHWVPCLDGGEALTLLHALLSGTTRPASSEVRAEMLDLCGGLPLFLRELVRHWQRTGQLSTPLSIAAHISTRLNRVSSTARRILQLSVLFGRASSLERIERVLQLSRPAGIEAWAELERAGMLTVNDQGVTNGPGLWSNASLAELPPSVARILKHHVALELEQQIRQTRRAPRLVVDDYLLGAGSN